MLFEDSGTKELYTSLSKKEADAHKESTNGWQPKLLDDEVKLGNMLKNQHKKKNLFRAYVYHLHLLLASRLYKICNLFIFNVFATTILEKIDMYSLN